MLEIQFEDRDDTTTIGQLDVGDTFVADQSDRDLPDPFMVVDCPFTPGPRVGVHAVNLRSGLIHTFAKGARVTEAGMKLYVKHDIKEA